MQDAVDVVEDIIVGQVVAERGAEPGDRLWVEVGGAAGLGECRVASARPGRVLIAPAGVVLRVTYRRPPTKCRQGKRSVADHADVNRDFQPILTTLNPTFSLARASDRGLRSRVCAAVEGSGRRPRLA